MHSEAFLMSKFRVEQNFRLRNEKSVTSFLPTYQDRDENMSPAPFSDPLILDPDPKKSMCFNC